MSSEIAADKGLLFNWKAKGASLRHLVLFLLVSLSVHVIGFYLFQIVYPTSGRLEPEPVRITLLSDSQPAVNAMLREVEDRLVFLRPASGDSDVRATLNVYSAKFQPSFSDRVPAFRVPSPVSILGADRGSTPDPLSVVQPELQLALPVVSAQPPKETAAPSTVAAETPGRWKVTGPLARRGIRTEAEFEASLPPLGHPPGVKIRLGIDMQGGIRFALPVSGNSHPQTAEVISAVRSSLRFEPKAEAELEWGWLEVSR